jgi:hypothetical protein
MAASLLKSLLLGVEERDELIKAKLKVPGSLVVDARKAQDFEAAHALGALSIPTWKKSTAS